MCNPTRYDNQTFLLCIDSYESDIPVGRFSNPCLGECGSFHGICQLIARIEQCLDIHDTPQAFQATRQFIPPLGLWHGSGQDAHIHPGAVATFVLQIRFRRNASWQGVLNWRDRAQTQNFRSALELINLLRSAAGESRLSVADPSSEKRRAQ